MIKFKLIKCALAGLVVLISFAVNAAPACGAKPLESANSYQALQWYRSSAEQKALYRQVFATGVATLLTNRESEPSKPWGVIFALDGTLLDNSAKTLNILQNCAEPSSEELSLWAKAELPATPGAVEATCLIQRNGGKVVIVSNRDGSEQSPFDMQVALSANLKKVGICYTSLIFANNRQDSNKNPRFVAVATGDYENIVTSYKKLPPLKIIGYFGSDIEDFPDFKQNTASKLSSEAEQFNQFGTRYFMLPNPAAGSWQHNLLK